MTKTDEKDLVTRIYMRLIEVTDKAVIVLHSCGITNSAIAKELEISEVAVESIIEKYGEKE